MGKINSFKDLEVWRLAMEITFDVYKIVGQLPKHEVYALGDQIRRSAISIPSNVAEGSKRNNRKEFNQFCGIAQGSAAELETQLLIVQGVYPDITVTDTTAKLNRVQMMLTKLRQRLRSIPTTHDQQLTNHDDS